MGLRQDDIKLTSHLTVNIGLRWKVSDRPSDGKGKLVDFWPTAASNDLAANPFLRLHRRIEFSGHVPNGDNTK